MNKGGCSTAATVNVDNIEDEDLLRQMWIDASEGDAKKQIRLRMYKLREERVKKFYNREEVLENILITSKEHNVVEVNSPPASVHAGKMAHQSSHKKVQGRPTYEPLYKMASRVANTTQSKTAPSKLENNANAKAGTIPKPKAQPPPPNPKPQRPPVQSEHREKVNEIYSKTAARNGKHSPPQRSKSDLHGTSIAQSKVMPRFMALTKSRENATVPNPNIKQEKVLSKTTPSVALPSTVHRAKLTCPADSPKIPGKNLIKSTVPSFPTHHSRVESRSVKVNLPPRPQLKEVKTNYKKSSRPSSTGGSALSTGPTRSKVSNGKEPQRSTIGSCFTKRSESFKEKQRDQDVLVTGEEPVFTRSSFKYHFQEPGKRGADAKTEESPTSGKTIRLSDLKNHQGEGRREFAEAAGRTPITGFVRKRTLAYEKKAMGTKDKSMSAIRSISIPNDMGKVETRESWGISETEHMVQDQPDSAIEENDTPAVSPGTFRTPFCSMGIWELPQLTKSNLKASDTFSIVMMVESLPMLRPADSGTSIRPLSEVEPPSYDTGLVSCIGRDKIGSGDGSDPESHSPFTFNAHLAGTESKMMERSHVCVANSVTPDGSTTTSSKKRSPTRNHSQLKKDNETQLAKIETDRENLGISVGASKTVSKAATRSADVTGELIPFVLGQLQASLDSIEASGGGALLRRQSQSGNQPTISTSPNSSAPQPSSTSVHSRNQSPVSVDPPPDDPIPIVAPQQECLFDSGTESGDDVQVSAKPSRTIPGELSSFMEGLRDTLNREGNPSGDKAAATPVVPEADLIQQVEKVLTVLRDSLMLDPQAQLKDGSMTGDLIALIDRLKVSLQRTPERAPSLPATVGSPSPPKEQKPPGPTDVSKLPWAAATGTSEGPWKIRAAKKRGLVRSRSIGVSDEEIEEARRHLEEEAFRSALQDGVSKSSMTWRRLGKFLPCEASNSRRLSTSYDDSPVQHHNFKPTRTISMDNKIENQSRAFFTTVEPLQIAVHKAAIQKQVTDEENRRRSNGSSIPAAVLPRQNAPAGVTRDFTLALPKPYVAPGCSSYDENDGNAGEQRRIGQFLVTKGSPRSIENVQISLKESGDMPQLQIAITLNTNPNETNKTRVNEKSRCQGEGSSDDSSKSNRYLPKSERKKKMKRANTIDAPPTGDVDFDEEGSENDSRQPLPIAPAPAASMGMPRPHLFFDSTRDPPLKPAFLTTGDNYWNSRFSTLKTSFESSSQGSSPSLSPVPPPCARAHQPHTHVQMHFNRRRDQNENTPAKPVWATSKPLSSVKNKLSVFENRSEDGLQSGQIVTEGWQTPNRNSAIFQKFESIGKKITPEPPPLLPRRSLSIAREVNPGLYSTESVENQGVHSVHATNCAIEAMQQRLTKPPPALPTHHFQQHRLVTREATPQWQISSQPAALDKLVPKFSHCNAPSLVPQISNIANEFVRVSRGTSLMKQKTSAFENREGITSHEPKLSVFMMAKGFDEAARQKTDEKLVPAAPVQLRQIPFQQPEEGSMNSPVVSRVMRGPQQQRATFSRQDISSLGPNHPSAERIRSFPVTERLQQPTEPQLNFLPKYMQFPPIVKSNSGDIISALQTSNALATQALPLHGHQSEMINPPLPTTIPRQKSLTEFPKPQSSVPPAKVAQPTPPPAPRFGNNLHSQNVSVPSPLLSTQSPKSHFANQITSQDSIKRTSSGSSIFDRARSLYISSRDAQGIVPPKTPFQTTQHRPKPPSLPRTGSIFPKQYEAQMSPESADKKQRQVEDYFKFQQAALDQAAAVMLVPNIPSRYFKAKRKEDEHLIRKSASQGQILNRQRSFSDGEDEDNVDQIFETLFKAAVEAKSAKTTVSGNKTVSEQAEMKATQSATQSKAVEKTASVQASKTPTGSTIVKKQSSVSTTSSSYASSTTTAQISTAKVASSSSKPIEGSSKNNVVKSGSGNKSGGKIFEYTNPTIKSSTNSVKDGLLSWCQGRTRAYKNVNITNFSSSWSDGLAFCALLHHFFPDAFDYDSLSSTNPKKNFDLAFELADKLAGIYPLLETEDMLIMGKNPDYKCIFTYVNAMYLKLKDLLTT